MTYSHEVGNSSVTYFLEQEQEEEEEDILITM
jgi:hypothetical protein